MNMTTVPSNQLKAMQHEIESLKEQVAHIKEIEFPTKCIAIANIWKNKVTLLDETIAQQAEAIRLKDEALLNLLSVIDSEAYPTIQNNGYDTVAIQPSPGILQARDELVAEACAKVAAPKVGISHDDYSLTIRNGTVKALRSGEWRKYL